MAERLQANTQSLVALVSEVLDSAHLDSGLLQRRESTFSLNEFAEAKCRRVIRTLCVETHESWLEDKRYLNMDMLREARKEQLRKAA